MNLVQATNTPIAITLAGARYKVRPLTFRELAAVSAWIEENVPSPLDRAVRSIEVAREAGKPLGDSVEELLLDHAQNAMLSWPPRAGSKPWFDALDGANGGLAELVQSILTKTTPGFTKENAETLVEAMTVAEVLDLSYLGVLGIRIKKDEPPTEEMPEPVAEEEAAPVAGGPRNDPRFGPWRE